MNRRLFLSIGALVFALAVVVASTGALFTDTQASQNNVFTTGGVSVALSNVVHNYKGAGAPTDPTGYGYNPVDGNFAFTDLKPLDTGELAFTIDNKDNEAYVCAYIGGTPPSATKDIALYDNLQFYAGANQMTFGEWVDLGVVGANGNTAYNVDYCFGDPVVNSGGIVGCNHGSIDFNPAQNGSFSADFYLFAIQTRNNAGFDCSALTFDPNEDDFVDVNYDYLAEQPVKKVGATAFAYAPVSPTCDLAVDDDGPNDGITTFSTLAAAEAKAADGQTICVDAGTYTESVTVDVPNVKIVGLNDPTGSNKATLDGRMDIKADGVSVSGLEFTNPTAGYALVIKGVSDTEVASSSFVNIATTLTTGSAQAVYYNGGTGAENGLSIHDNKFDNVGNPALTKSVKAIFIGDSTAPAALTGVSIVNNAISNVLTSSVTSGAYGILINFGAGVTTPEVRNNTITTLNGYWAHAVGLETSTPGAEVTYNAISNVTGAGGDSQGVFFEANPNSDVQINFNNFAPGVAYGVGIHSSNPAITVDAELNWWGDTDPSDNVVGAGIDYTPFELAAYATN